jgi:hypothetical protein
MMPVLSTYSSVPTMNSARTYRPIFLARKLGIKPGSVEGGGPCWVSDLIVLSCCIVRGIVGVEGEVAVEGEVTAEGEVAVEGEVAEGEV